MSKWKNAGVGEERRRTFVIYTKVNGVSTVATLTGLKITLFKRLAGEEWTDAESINTTDNPAELQIVDVTVDDVVKTDGGIKILPLTTWWADDVAYELAYRVESTPPYWIPDTEFYNINVVKRPT